MLGRSAVRRTLSMTVLAGTVIATLTVSSPVTNAAPPAAPALAAQAGPGPAGLGPDVIIFNSSMAQSDIQQKVDEIAAEQVGNQFGTQRYALLFEPGTYGSSADPLIFQVGYYTEVAGLGTSPSDVVINGSIDVYNQCFPTDDPNAPNCIALDNFWRSMSNLTINVAGGSGCQAATEFWAVSQAAPMRRVAVNGNVSLMDYCNGGPDFASGGFIADSAFTGGTVINGSQQQFLVRNSALDGWTNAVWNQVFSGVTGAPAQSFPNPPYTTLATSSVTREKPFLATDSHGSFQVVVPNLQNNSSGTSWTAPSASIPIQKFFIANPATPVPVINLALALGKNLILTPGVYNLKQTILVTRPDTVILGLGFPTLVPQHGNTAMWIADVPGTKLSGIIFDAGPKNSKVLLQVGSVPGLPWGGRANDPTLIQDVFFRIGGATPGRATTSLVVNSSEVILDDLWVWRADHGAGVGWTQNTADTGLVVNGNNVTAFGLFVEHFQKTEVIWNGQGGSVVFFQNEMPYDPPSQAAWNLGPAFNGYPAFTVSKNVRTFQGFGMGSYSFFNQGVAIQATTAFQVPNRPGVALHDLLTVFLDGSGSIQHVVNDTGAAVTAAAPGVPSTVVSYP